MSQLHTFEHKAMKTVFTLRIIEADEQLAKSAARSAIELLDEIEHKLSRYVEGSDVWQINHMQAGQTLILCQECYDCLRIGLEAYEQTGGLFDITLGRLIEHRKNENDGPTPEVIGQLMVAPDRPSVHCSEPGREIDLGGIGKGFALDRMQIALQELGIESALLSAGASTQLAFGPKAWRITLNGDHLTKTIELKQQALSASGIGVQGSHIISPRGDESDYPHPRIWILDTTAAGADIWSTTAMLMTAEEVQSLVDSGAEIIIDQAES